MVLNVHERNEKIDISNQSKVNERTGCIVQTFECIHFLTWETPLDDTSMSQMAFNEGTIHMVKLGL